MGETAPWSYHGCNLQNGLRYGAGVLLDSFLKVPTCWWLDMPGRVAERFKQLRALDVQIVWKLFWWRHFKKEV